MKPSYFIFDLDDTLFYEIKFLKSAYKEIALLVSDEKLFTQMYKGYKKGEDVFQKIETEYAIDKQKLIEMYRSHIPTIFLNKDALKVLNVIKSKGNYLGLITDGRSITQRNKLKSLKIESLFDKIIVSEEFGSTKPNAKNYEIFIQNKIDNYWYIGDNTTKDFLTPNSMGWKTVCLLDKGYNIHKQNFELPQAYLPQHTIKELKELNVFIDK